MEERLQHDPRTKQQIKDILFEHLYGPVERHFKKQLNEIIIKNSALLNTAEQHFSYKGVVYALNAAPAVRKMIRLAPALHNDMDLYLKETRQLNNTELPYVLGFINQVLNSSNNLQDYLKILPESVHGPIQQLIASCPCRVLSIDPEHVKQLKEKNKTSIDMIKQRMLSNLLL